MPDIVKTITVEKSPAVMYLGTKCIRLGLKDKYRAVAGMCSENVVVSDNTCCCGFGGDGGLLYPELTLLVPKSETHEVKELEADAYYSSNVPCEIGFSSAVGKQ